MTRCIWNREQLMCFDGNVGEYRAVTELRWPEAEYGNLQEDILEQTWAEADRVCRHNYQVDTSFTWQQRVEPTVTISPSRTEAPNHHNLLACLVRFLSKPDQSLVVPGRPGGDSRHCVYPLIRNRDWTFQVLVMLEMISRRGDVHTCHVEHPSLQSPIKVEWRTQSESAQSKMLSGIEGCMLRMIFLGLGLFHPS